MNKPLNKQVTLTLFRLPLFFISCISLISLEAQSASAAPRQKQQSHRRPASSPPASRPAQAAAAAATPPVQAAQAPSTPLFNAPTSLTSTPSAASRSNSLTFEDEVISGMNRNPLDSLTQIGKGDNHNQNRLYRKKEHFKLELIYSIRETGLVR